MEEGSGQLISDELRSAHRHRLARDKEHAAPVILTDDVVADAAAGDQKSLGIRALEERLCVVSRNLCIEHRKAVAAVRMQQVECVPVGSVFFAVAAVPDCPVHKTDVLTVEGFDGSVGAVMDDRVFGNNGEAFRRRNSIGAAAVEVAVLNADPAAAVEVQNAAGTVPFSRCVSCREIGDVQIITAVRRQDIGVSGFGHNAAVLYIAALQPESGDISDYELVSIPGIHPVPVFSRTHVSVGPGLCQVVFPVFQLNHAVRPDRIQKFIHGADPENSFRSYSVCCIGSRFFGMGRRSNPAPETGDQKKQCQQQGKQRSCCMVRSFFHDLLSPFRDR